MLTLAGLTICFAFVLLIGAPYLPTGKKQIEQALTLLDLRPGQTLYELGAGSGGLTLAAAKQGIHVTAYEVNPILVLVLKWRCRKLKHVNIVNKNFWKANLQPADGIYVFLLDRFMSALDVKISKQAKAGTKLVSYTFKIRDKKPAKTLGPMYLYEY
ncbi:hypothetical protein KC878_02505 [Candidatus Saccharibacteria bacterium]|nr:hypothetical protein [Candidatus Saccharibacteria bacterium]